MALTPGQAVLPAAAGASTATPSSGATATSATSAPSVDARTDADAATALASTITYVVREGPQTRVDHVLVSGTDAHVAGRSCGASSRSSRAARSATTRVLESQQRLSALGLFRRVRITEAPHGADETRRDVLVEVEEAPSTSLSYGGGLEVGQRPRRGDGGDADRSVRRRAARLLRDHAAEPVGQEPVDQPAHVGQRAPARDPGVDGRAGRRGRLRPQPVPRRRHVPGAARLRHAGDAQVERVHRARHPVVVQLRSARRARRSTRGASPTGSSRSAATPTTTPSCSTQRSPVADQLLIDRLFPQVRLSTIFGSVIRDSRNDVLDPERGHVLGADLRARAARASGRRSASQGVRCRPSPTGGCPARGRSVVAAGARLGLARGFETRVPRVDASGSRCSAPTGSRSSTS